LFHGLVLALRLAVCLGMKGGRKAVIDAHVRANSIPESAGELCAAVGDDIIRYAVLADHVFEKHSCQFR